MVAAIQPESCVRTRNRASLRPRCRPCVRESGYPRFSPAGLGLRFYSPSLGKWLSRDPVEEGAGIRLYAFVANQPVQQHDPLGLASPQYHYFANAKLAVGLEPFYEADRRIRMTCTLSPAKTCECDLVDFLQTYTIVNLEGQEAKYNFGPSQTGFPQTSGQWYTDLPPGATYYIRYLLDSGGEVAGYGISGKYEESFLSWMTDHPGGLPSTPDIWFEFQDANGNAVKRRSRWLLKTCGVCIEGEMSGTTLGCVNWKLDYPNLQQGSKPAISILGFVGN